MNGKNGQIKRFCRILNTITKKFTIKFLAYLKFTINSKERLIFYEIYWLVFLINSSKNDENYLL